MSLSQTSLDMAKAQHRRSTISIISFERLASVTEKLNLSSCAVSRCPLAIASEQQTVALDRGFRAESADDSQGFHALLRVGSVA